MNEEALRRFCDSWISEEDDEGVSGLRPSEITVRHGGRYKVTFGNQGFVTTGFGEYAPDDGSGKRTSRLYQYLASPDVWYYDAKLDFEGGKEYAVGFMIDLFGDRDALGTVSDTLSEMFTFVAKRDYAGLGKFLSDNGIAASEDGRADFDLMRVSHVGQFSVAPLKRGL